MKFSGSTNIIHKPDVVISGSRYIGSCDSLALTVGSSTGNIGKPLYFKWSAYSDNLLWDTQSGSTYILTLTALETFGVESLRIELWTENWVCLFILYHW